MAKQQLTVLIKPSTGNNMYVRARLNDAEPPQMEYTFDAGDSVQRGITAADATALLLMNQFTVQTF